MLQLISSNKALEAIKTLLAQKANAIIADELDLQKPVNFFLEKDRQALTVYYFNDMTEKAVTDFIPSLDIFCNKNLQDFSDAMITISHDIDFFGTWHDELVIKITDHTNTLATLHNTLKDMVHAFDNDYKKQHAQHCYDQESSEHYPYVPHISLGRIRSRSIKDQVQDFNQRGLVLERIKERIKEACSQIINDVVNNENAKLVFEKFVFFSSTKQTSIKEYASTPR